MSSRARQVTAFVTAAALALAFPACGSDGDADQLEREAKEGSEQIEREAEELNRAVTEGDRQAIEKQQREVEREAKELKRRLEEASP